MTSKMKQWVALTAVGVLAVMAAGWFLLVSPKRAEASRVEGLVTSQNATNTGLEAQLSSLKAMAKTLPQQQAKLAAVAAKIPDNPALPALIRALSSAADTANVELVSLAPSTPAPVAAVAPTGARPLGQPVAGSAGASAASSKPAATLSNPGVGASSPTTGQLNAIALNINVVGGYFQIEQFFDQVENLTRALKVTGFSLAPGANPMKAQSGSGSSSLPVANTDPGKVLSANVTANVYMALGRAVAPVAAAPVK